MIIFIHLSVKVNYFNFFIIIIIPQNYLLNTSDSKFLKSLVATILALELSNV